ncbi:glycosyltransferase family A protein [Sphingomonas sp. HF-S3]|uniref:Glycosyltransferase family A protein n=1 Tax=Sphingomonas rustica TaxID=3103142 RepID=A0ABV0B388_9SPHN
MSAIANACYEVILPAFNAARTIEAALHSVLAQTLPPDRIIVADDGSTDDTASIARSFGDRVTLVRQANLGPAAATDLALAHSRATLIAGMDADDIWFPTKAERQLGQLGGDDRLDGVFCHAVNFNHGEEPSADGPSRPLWGRSAMMIRRSIVDRIGPVHHADTPRALGEMVRWLDSGRRLGARFSMMPDCLVGRRLIEGSLSHARDPKALLPMLRARLKDRR